MEAKLRASNGDLSSIPPHIFQEILLKLEAESLVRCAFVCKDWNHLITSPDFISRSSHRSVDSRNQILFIRVCRCHNSEGDITCSLHWDNDQFDLIRTLESPTIEPTRLIGVSNGLICLYTMHSSKFILSNPTVRKYACFPLTMTVFSRRYSEDSASFGFDPTSNDFKVINFVYDDKTHQIVSVWIFSCLTWSWKHVKCSVPPSLDIHSMSVCLNGVIHWIGVMSEDEHEFILTFDLAHEVVAYISLPGGMETTCFIPNKIQDSILFLIF